MFDSFINNTAIIIPDDAVERRKLGVNKERTTVALKGFI